MLKKKGHVIEYLDDYLHDLLTSSEARYVEEHCESCRICAVAREEARKRMEAIQALAPCEVSEELIRSTMDRVGSYAQGKQRLRKYVLRAGGLAFAASVALVAILHVYYLTLSVSPYDLKVAVPQTQLADAPGALRVQMMNRDTKKPAADVPIDIELSNEQEQVTVRLASFTTDAQGTGRPSFHLPDWKNGEYTLRVISRTRKGTDTIKRKITLTRSWKVMLSTDKPVYQPGQTILIRSLGLKKPDLKPVAGHEVLFSIKDPKGNIVFKQPAVTSKYGIAFTECPLATEIIEGAYTITCAIGNTESQTTVEVKPYVLPKFKINLELDRPFYQPRQVVRGSVDAQYFFGKPVADSRVEVTLRGRDVGPDVIAKLSVHTDSTGKAAFQCTLPGSLVGRPDDGGDARIWIDAKVTDTADQSHSVTQSRTVTTRPIRIQAIPEGGELVRDVANTIYLLTQYADGRPASTRLVIAGISEEIRTSPSGVATIEIIPRKEPRTGGPTSGPQSAPVMEITPQDAQVILTMRASDDHGVTCQERMTLTCGATQDDFLVRPDKAVYTGGETMQLDLVGGGSEPVFVDFIKDGQVLLTQSVAISQGQGQLHFDIPLELFGTVEIQAYRFGTRGLANRKSRVVYIHQARQIAVEASLDRPEYRPGQPAKIELNLKDEQGRPAPGAISLAAVDEAVFAVLEQAPGMEQAFFNLEQELLQPIYAIYPWTPAWMDEQQKESRKNLERALFARTARNISNKKSAVFQQLIDQGQISPRTLDVLEYEELDQVLERTWISDELRDLIKSGNDDTVFVSSYPAKTRQILADRRSGLAMVKTVWVGIGVFGLIAGLVSLWYVFGKPVIKVVVVFLMLLFVASMLLPSLSRARECSRIVGVAAGLHALSMAIEMAKIDGTPISAIPPAETEVQPAIRVREWFPETLLWRPEIITDDQGRATIDVDLADSITTWRLTASAITGDGRLGALQSGIRVFQPFFVDLNLPVTLTRNDEVSVPVVVYNYLDQPQTVTLDLKAADWFELLDETGKTIDLGPNEVRSVAYRIRVGKVGRYTFEITARAGDLGDAIRKDIEVVPNGRRVEQVFNGALNQPADIALDLPKEAIEGSAKAILKVYPSSFSQLLEGLENIFQRPYGCFEQTSSTTYPNILALDYLRRTKTNVPEVEAKARQYIHLGYQRLLTFEVAGGGFDWFGCPPANRTLSAYGLMEFEDMARVHDVDPELIMRTREWLLKQRNADGSWSPENHQMHMDPTVRGKGLAQLSTTAYIAWAVFCNGNQEGEPSPTLSYLKAHKPSQIDDPYVLALVCNALQALDPKGNHKDYVERLVNMKQHSKDGKLVCWGLPTGSRTAFHGAGRGGNIETTALATLVLLRAQDEPATVKGALSWLVAQKDSLGTFHSTQATVLALKALIEGSNRPLGGSEERRIRIAVGNSPSWDLRIPADQADVMKQVDLTEYLAVGSQHIQLTETNQAGTNYQLAYRYYLPAAKPDETEQPLSIELTYDKTELFTGDTVTATARIVSHMPAAVPMVILDLPIPPGFAVNAAEWNNLRNEGTIAKYDLTPRSVIVYLRGLETGKPLSIKYRLDATMPVNITTPPAKVYEYYDPDNRNSTQPTRIQVRPRA